MTNFLSFSEKVPRTPILRGEAFLFFRAGRALLLCLSIIGRATRTLIHPIGRSIQNLITVVLERLRTPLQARPID